MKEPFTIEQYLSISHPLAVKMNVLERMHRWDNLLNRKSAHNAYMMIWETNKDAIVNELKRKGLL